MSDIEHNEGELTMLPIGFDSRWFWSIRAEAWKKSQIDRMKLLFVVTFV